MQRFPSAVTVEFRGIERSEYVDRETGEVKERQPVLKFERQVGADGLDVDLIELPVGQFEKMVPPLDWTKIRRGEHFVLSGEVVIYGRNERWRDGRPMEAYFDLSRGSWERVANGKVEPAKAS